MHGYRITTLNQIKFQGLYGREINSSQTIPLSFGVLTGPTLNKWGNRRCVE